MKFWQNISPGLAVHDLAEAWRDNPYRWRVLAVSIALTSVIFWNFLPESQRADPRPPEVTYITTWEADRTDAEIIASNIAAQKRKEQLAALEAKREELRKELYRQLGRATFIDVDAMERKIAREEAQEQAGAAASPAAPPPTIPQSSPVAD